VKPADDPRRARYLLGELTPEEQEAFELEYFRDDESFDLVRAADDDLLDAYVAGTLDAERSRRLREQLRASPFRRARVEAARAFRTALERAGRRAAPAPAPARGPARLWPSLAAGLAAALVFSLLGLRAVRLDLQDLRREHDGLSQHAAEQDARVAALERDRATASAGTDGIGLFILRPGLERGAQETALVSRGDDLEWLRLRLVLPPDAPDAEYGATLETPDGRTLAALHALSVRRPAPRAVDVVCPARGLAPGTYIVNLTHRPRAARPEPVESYTFRLVAAR
jgi:hypothetical protein